METDEAVDLLLAELAIAIHKHPEWHGRKDFIHGAAIMCEEAGESIQAALELTYGGPRGTLEQFRREVAQTGAMALRILINLPSQYSFPGPIKE